MGLGYRLRMELTLNQRMAVTRVIAVRYRCAGVACQGDGTTRLPGGWDHRGALLRMLVGGIWVKLGAGALAVGRSFDDQGVGGGGQPVDG